MNDNEARRKDQAGDGPPAEEQQPAADGISAAEDALLLDQLRADLEAAKDRLLRSQAELDNYRKRAAREIEDHRRYANLPLLRDLLPVLDNLERTIAAAEKSPDSGALLAGVKLIAKQLDDMLGRYHCVRIGGLHQPFDPNLHHAVLQQPAADLPPNTVVAVTQPGFQLHDRVVRPSQVIVSGSKDQEPSD
ncbi:MAG: nucleotide exchange factor GrpE [Thermoguttaceae bacterium]|jgi:molecular chaperone GrpE